MDTKDFEYLVEIARQESLSKAAARLYLSQPTLTKFLKKIEAEYGTPLFDRVGKKMVLTEAGRCCVQKSEQILALTTVSGYCASTIKASSASASPTAAPIFFFTISSRPLSSDTLT